MVELGESRERTEEEQAKWIEEHLPNLPMAFILVRRRTSPISKTSSFWVEKQLNILPKTIILVTPHDFTCYPASRSLLPIYRVVKSEF